MVVVQGQGQGHDDSSATIVIMTTTIIITTNRRNKNTIVPSKISPVCFLFSLVLFLFLCVSFVFVFLWLTAHNLTSMPQKTVALGCSGASLYQPRAVSLFTSLPWLIVSVRHHLFPHTSSLC